MNTNSSHNDESSKDPSPDEEEDPKKASDQILRHELKEALEAFDRPPGRTFFSALSAGLEIGFSLFLMATMQTLVQREFSPALTELLVANMYSFGFILVILGRSELFTEQTSLAALPVLSGQASVGALIKLWGIVYLANLIGAALSAWLIVFAAVPLGVIKPEVLADIATGIVDHPAHVIVLSGILAGWLMGLLSWLVAAGRDTISQIVIVWLITAAIGLGHLHHCILGSVEVLGGVFATGGPGPGECVHFLIWSTLGNAIGGPVFLAILKYTHARTESEETNSLLT